MNWGFFLHTSQLLVNTLNSIPQIIKYSLYMKKKKVKKEITIK